MYASVRIVCDVQYSGVCGEHMVLWMDHVSAEDTENVTKQPAGGRAVADNK